MPHRKTVSKRVVFETTIKIKIGRYKYILCLYRQLDRLQQQFVCSVREIYLF